MKDQIKRLFKWCRGKEVSITVHEENDMGHSWEKTAEGALLSAEFDTGPYGDMDITLKFETGEVLEFCVYLHDCRWYGWGEFHWNSCGPTEWAKVERL